MEAVMGWLHDVRSAILDDKERTLEVDKFIRQLIDFGLMTHTEEMDNGEKSGTKAKIYHIFSILFTKDPEDTESKLRKVLKATNGESYINEADRKRAALGTNDKVQTTQESIN
ncbi:unnamed protein product [Darwinula stevensoni]|uniref:Uncharacterized protein n=1 Tax=Darwinula stevensoni TaxID=69355 RepID=A0A7R8XJH6_9CRUS|nr:unnamed protein product [Darwinula stevensoni]CAG0894839.1 unnamed protein product [Darwinula stevensoni]